MNSVYAVCLIAFAIHVIGVPAFIWAVKTRQISESDQEAYHALLDDGGTKLKAAHGMPETARVRPVPMVQMVLFFGLMITLFVLMMCSLVVVVIAAGHTPGAPVAP